MATQRVDRLRPLADQQIPQPEDHAQPLLRGRLHFDKAHGRSAGGLHDRLGIRHVVLLVLDIRLDELRRDQSHFMAQIRQCPRPVMSSRAGLHRHPALWLRLHEGEELLARKPLAEHDFALGCRPVKLKDLLGQVHADDRYFLHSQILLIQPGSQWHKCRQEGLPNTSSEPRQV